MIRTKILAAGLVTVLSTIGLTACGGEQSVADACKVANATVKEAEGDITSSMSEAGSGDYSKVTESFKKLSSSLKDAEGKITNKEVKDALGNFRGSIDEFSGLFEGVKDGDTEALTQKADQLETVNTKLSESAKKISELCPAA